MNKKSDELRNSNFQGGNITKYRTKQTFADTMEKGYFSSGKEVIEKALGGKGIGMTISQTLEKCIKMGEPGSKELVDFQNRVYRKYKHKILAYDNYRKRDLKTKFSEDVLCLSMTGTGFVYNTIKKYNSTSDGDDPDQQKELEMRPRIKKSENKDENKEEKKKVEDKKQNQRPIKKQEQESEEEQENEFEELEVIEIDSSSLSPDDFYEKYGRYPETLVESEMDDLVDIDKKDVSLTKADDDYCL